MIKILNRQSKINEILLKISSFSDTETYTAQHGTAIAEPGDLLFLLTNCKKDIMKDRVKDKKLEDKIRAWMMYWWKPWAGLERDDLDAWHIGIYIFGRKRKNHNRTNIWMIHSNIKGVNMQHITPASFTNKCPEVMSRFEILKYVDISEEQRRIIVNFANSKIGLEFDMARMRHAILTYAFGLPNLFYNNQNQFSCQQLAIAAYAAAGIHFPHPYKAFPIFNIGRYLGHPLGHPRDRVDPRYPYLMDHHIYRDPRFVLKAAVHQDPNTDEIILQTENLKKYSWNETLREKYIKKGYLDP